MFHNPLRYTPGSRSVDDHLPRSSTRIRALLTLCHWNIELIDWSEIPSSPEWSLKIMIAARNVRGEKGVGAREKTKSALSRFVARSVILPWKVEWKMAEERMGRVKMGGWCGTRPRRTYKLWRERSRHQPLGRPGNLGRATRLSCFTKTIISSRQRYALSAVGRRDDDRRVRTLWLANVELASRARRSLELLSAIFYGGKGIPARSLRIYVDIDCVTTVGITFLSSEFRTLNCAALNDTLL